MIRIRYKDFSAGTHDCTGSHGRAVDGDRGVTVYLVPGLSAGERRAVFRRLRQEASRGFSAPLPGPQLAVARALDRVAVAARTTASVVRLHPAITLLPGACVLAGTAFFVAAAADGPALPDGPQPGLAAPVTAGTAPASVLPASVLSASAASISALMTGVAGVDQFSADAVGSAQTP